jgi:hypothetical protein
MLHDLFGRPGTFPKDCPRLEAQQSAPMRGNSYRCANDVHTIDRGAEILRHRRVLTGSLLPHSVLPISRSASVRFPCQASNASRRRSFGRASSRSAVSLTRRPSQRRMSGSSGLGGVALRDSPTGGERLLRLNMRDGRLKAERAENKSGSANRCGGDGAETVRRPVGALNSSAGCRTAALRHSATGCRRQNPLANAETPVLRVARPR